MQFKYLASLPAAGMGTAKAIQMALEYSEGKLFHLCIHLSSLLPLPSSPGFVPADFGFARYLQTNMMAATLCGSPMYMVSLPLAKPRPHIR